MRGTARSGTHAELLSLRTETPNVFLHWLDPPGQSHSPELTERQSEMTVSHGTHGWGWDGVFGETSSWIKAHFSYSLIHPDVGSVHKQLPLRPSDMHSQGPQWPRPPQTQTAQLCLLDWAGAHVKHNLLLLYFNTPVHWQWSAIEKVFHFHMCNPADPTDICFSVCDNVKDLQLRSYYSLFHTAWMEIRFPTSFFFYSVFCGK